MRTKSLIVHDFLVRRKALRTLHGEILVLKGWMVPPGDAKVRFYVRMTIQLDQMEEFRNESKN